MKAQEIIEDLARWLHDETAHPESYPNHTWPETERDDGRREGGWVKIVPLHGQEYFRDIGRRLVARYLAAQADACTPTIDSVPSCGQENDYRRAQADASGGEVVAWQWRYVGDKEWRTPSGGMKIPEEVLKRERPIEHRPLYASLSDGKHGEAIQEEMENYRMALSYIAKQSNDKESRELAETALTSFEHGAGLPQTPWHPIETAPKDGSAVLATGGGLADVVDIVTYNERVGAWNATNYTLDDRDEEADGYSRPTHWMPLPAAPVTRPHRENPQA